MRLGSEPLWALSLYPEAGEGGGCLSVRRIVVPVGGPPNVERAAEEAARRARGKIRRYAAANRLNRLGTLTYRGEGCHDPVALRAHLGGFFRELRDQLDAGGFAYLWVPQWHPGGHGLHAHFAVGRFVPRRVIEQRVGARLRPHQAARWATGRLRRAGRSTTRGSLLGALRRPGSGRGAPAGGAASVRGRARLPTGEDRVLRRERGGRDRARLGAHGRSTGARMAVLVGGGVAWAARLLGAVELTS